MTLRVREVPPLRASILATTPSGRSFRWGQDEPNPANVLGNLSFGDSMPGGETDLSVTLARKPGVSYSDLERLSKLQVYGPGGEFVAGYRLERTPRTSGDQMAIEPSAVGWQAHLDDDKSASEVYVDRDLSHWEGLSSTGKSGLLSAYNVFDFSLNSDDAAYPSIETSLSFPTVHQARCQPQYDAGPGSTVSQIYYDFVPSPVVLPADGNWYWAICYGATDDLGGMTIGADLRAVSGSGYFTTGTRYVWLLQQYQAANASTDPGPFSIFWRKLAVYGNHGLPIRGTAPGGLYASDVIAHAVGTWAPLLNFTTGSDGSIQASDFVVPQLAFREPTTAAEIIKQANRFHLRDWAVWDSPSGPIFYYHDRGARGKRWRARIGPTQLQETGPQVDRVWNSIMVRFQDVDGSSKTVGPPGSGADVEDAVLRDDDELNPANQAGITRRDLLDMGIVSTAAGATEVGRRFLEETKALDSSGSAQIVGYCTDDHGIKRPYWQLRSGDEISFVDASDTSYRRIVRTQKDHGTRTCSIDLDAPPEGMDALLERLGVVLVSIL